MGDLRERFWKSHWRTALGAVAGAAGGAIYAQTIGCKTGTCLLTSNAWTAALFFGFAAGLAAWPSRPAARQAPAQAEGQPRSS